MAFWNLIINAFIHIRQWLWATEGFMLNPSSKVKFLKCCLVGFIWSKGITVTESDHDTAKINECPWFCRPGAKSSVQLIHFHLYCLWPRSSVKCVHLKCYQVEVVNALCSAADTSWRRSRVANTGQVRQPYLGSPLAPHWQMASEKGPMVMKPSPPSLMTRCGGYLSSLGGRALALPCSRPVALSCPPLLEQQARFQGGPYCQRRHPFLVAAVHPVDKDRKQSDIRVINLPGYVKGKPETCGWEGSCC